MHPPLSDHSPMSVHNLRNIAKVLFYLNALIWLGLTIASLINAHQTSSLTSLVRMVVILLMAGNAAAMLIAGLCMAKLNLKCIYFAIVLLFVNILLTFTDQFGFLDLITLMIDIFLLALLAKIRLTLGKIDRLE